MKSQGEIYITEDCTKTFMGELDREFGKGEWKLDSSRFKNWSDMSTFPQIVIVDVISTKTDIIIGKATITSEPTISEDEFGKIVIVKPITIEVTKQ